jgi:transcriptional regulator with XRE-family HTH domain
MNKLETEITKAIKLRFAVGLHKALKDSALKSYRKLAKEAELEPAHIQKIANGKKDISLTTTIAIAKALGITYSKLSAYYDNVTEKDTQEFLIYLEKQKQLRGKEKIPEKAKKKPKS